MTAHCTLKVDHKTGALTVSQGRETWPLSPDRRWVVPLEEILHGYVVTNAHGRVLERHMVAMVSAPVRPMPPGGGYASSFEQAGPRSALSINLRAVDGTGDLMAFEVMGQFNQTSIRGLLETSIYHVHTSDGAAGFIHPVAQLGADCRYLRRGPLWFIRFTIVDWVHSDGRRLLSQQWEAEIA